VIFLFLEERKKTDGRTEIKQKKEARTKENKIEKIKRKRKTRRPKQRGEWK
jgi:hypothetical protein